MKKNAFIIVGTALLLMVAFAFTATAASCTNSCSSGTCPNSLKACTKTCTDCKITGVTITPKTGVMPFKPLIKTSVAGKCSKVAYTAINAKTGKTVSSCSCKICPISKSGSCRCTIAIPGVYNLKVTAYGPDGCCTTYTMKNAFIVFPKK